MERSGTCARLRFSAGSISVRRNRRKREQTIRSGQPSSRQWRRHDADVADVAEIADVPDGDHGGEDDGWVTIREPFSHSSTQLSRPLSWPLWLDNPPNLDRRNCVCTVLY